MQSLSGQIRLDSTSRGVSDNDDLRAPIVFRSKDGLLALKGDVRHNGSRVTTPQDSARLLEAFRKRGIETLESFRGPFSVFIALPREQRAIIAVDRMGIERLAWAQDDGLLVFGSSAEDVAARAFASPRLEHQAIFDFMLGHMIPAPRTVFSDVFKLRPGTAVEVVAGTVREVRYWHPDFDRAADTDVSRLSEAVLPTLKHAVELAQPDDETGAFLSGGLDSSTVAGLLSQVNDSSANAFSVGFGVAEFDELEFARAASEHFGCRHYCFEVTADHIVEAVPKIAAAYDEPFGNSSAVPTYYCALLARQNGITHLLAGDGGDELFGGNERYVRHAVFELYAKIPGPLRDWIFEPAAAAFDPETSLLPLRKFSSYVRQAKIPLPERFESWNLIYREGPDRVFSDAFLAEVDPRAPLRQMAETWNDCPSSDLLDRMLWYDWKFTLADNDIRKVSTMSELAGVKVTYPMLEEDFVDLSIRVPSREKIRDRELRTFFRNAVRDFLPEKVIQKQKHGFGLPFGQWLKSHRGLQSLVYGSLESLRDRGIFNDAFIARVAEEHREGHASYYGYAIWDLVMLEQWFQHHRPDAVA